MSTIHSNSLPVLDQHDALAIVHRDTHFGGNFAIMLDYYKQATGKGMHPEITLEQIQRLQQLEQLSQYNLNKLLNPAEQALIKDAQDSYHQLKQLYSIDSRQLLPAQKIADLILSEEEEPVEIIQEITALKEEAVPALLGIIDSENFYHSAFPGYGAAPEMAVRCLCHIKSPNALPVLFSKIGKGDFFFEDVVIEALVAIGQEAKIFLIEKLSSLSASEESEKAAIALIHFPPDKDLAQMAIEKLQDPKFHQYPILLGHLALIACSVTDPVQLKQIEQIHKDSCLPELVRMDLAQLLSSKKQE